MAWLELPMKVAASSDIAWARSMHPLNPGLPNGTSYFTFRGWNAPCRSGNLPNWNILVGRGRESKIAIPWVTASENGVEQTESPVVMQVEMWCCPNLDPFGLKLKLTGMFCRRGWKPRKRVIWKDFFLVCVSSVHWILGVNVGGIDS